MGRIPKRQLVRERTFRNLLSVNVSPILILGLCDKKLINPIPQYVDSITCFNHS